MSKKWIIHVMTTLVLCIIVSVVYYLNHTEQRDEMSEETFMKIVSTYYLDSSGKIRSYGTTDNDEYLLESIGLYMSWLQKHEKTEELASFIETVTNEFLVHQGNAAFLSWKIEGNQKLSSNAWIDDARILSILGPKHSLSKDIISTIEKYQVYDGLIMDFYDWEQKQASQRVVFSYGSGDDTPISIKKMDDLYHTVSESSDLFFPEFYDVTNKDFIAMEEVHMVDQLLIAIQLEKTGLDNDEFWTWLQTEWENNNLISGKYNRSSRLGNQIESGAVYGIAAALATLKNDDNLSNAWKQRGQQLVYDANNGYEDIHFFDLIWNAP
ncbi:hypothetical protein [Ornithinibacillus xuwenensis]|uniref:Glycoside hydrolase n=1 Tax=Ornithinibacillus xuwenensis TaxID=3144668 RepID=A0ABU9XLL7_9BACI